MATIGQIESYQRDSEDWLQYIEQLKFFFEANGIRDAARKRAAFLSIIGPDTFKTLLSIIAPSKPDEKSYEELVTELSNHYRPKRSQIYYRSQFYRSNRQPGDTIASTLRTIANDCEFGDTLNIMIRDRLVCGINDVTIQKRLKVTHLHLKKLSQLLNLWKQQLKIRTNYPYRQNRHLIL